MTLGLVISLPNSLIKRMSRLRRVHTVRGASDLKTVSSDRLKTILLDVTSSESIKAAYEEVKGDILEGKGKTDCVTSRVISGA